MLGADVALLMSAQHTLEALPALPRFRKKEVYTYKKSRSGGLSAMALCEQSLFALLADIEFDSSNYDFLSLVFILISTE